MIEKIWWWGTITNGLKSPNDLYLEAKNQNMSRYGGYIYNVTLSYNIYRYFICWLILRGDNTILISLITKKTYIEQLWRLTYMIFYLQNVLNSHGIQRQKYFYEMILMSSSHCETKATSENLRIVNDASELSWRPQHTLRATCEAKPEILTFLPYNFHFLLHKDNFDARIHIWGREVSQK